jgi:hypothetical protein
LWSVALVIEAGGFDGTDRQTPAQDYDCLGFFQGILDDQPSAYRYEQNEPGGD